MRNIAINYPVTHRVSTRKQTTALHFEPLTIDAIHQIKSILPLARSRANDFSLGGLFMWADYFNYEYCIYGNTLFVKGVSELNHESPAFSLPVGAMPLSCAVDLLTDYCRTQGIPLRFSAVPDERIDELREAVPGRIVRLDDWSDYIYDAQSLASLSGKRYNKKRNHVHRFMADNPGFKTEVIDLNNIGAVRSAYTRWLTDKAIDSASAAEESLQTFKVLDDYHLYPFHGLILRDGKGEIVAFTIGEIIGDTLFTHIEKMNHEVTGAGETINKLFAEHVTRLYPKVAYINREEDAGDEGLRQAKLSYHPAIILHKYDVEI